MYVCMYINVVKIEQQNRTEDEKENGIKNKNRLLI